MSIASEIARLRGVKADILRAISDKGVEVPSGSMLDDCPDLIASISGGGGFEADNIVNIVPINKMVVVDSNGYIGFDLTNYFQYGGSRYYYNYAILSTGDDFSSKGLGQVTIYTPSSNNIGGRVYNTVVIGGKEWMAENLDFKFSGCGIGGGDTPTIPNAWYYNNDEATYGIDGTRKCGLLYNWHAVKLLNDNRNSLIPGWHVPTSAEWDALANAVGGTGVAGTRLKAIDGAADGSWPTGWNGTDDYGFSAFPAGSRRSGYFRDLGGYAYFWTANEYSSSDAPNRYFYTGASMDSDYYGLKTNAFSVRLVKDSQ